MVLAQQFEVATDFGSLLRANTPASRMMTAYTRRGPGQQYLKSVLSEPIHQVAKIEHMDLEINPLKVIDAISALYRVIDYIRYWNR
jgi:Ras GTPase-activating-like protein IQGAP2/3